MNLELTDDGTYTLYSKEFNQHYHSTKDGALTESLIKHIVPAFDYTKNKQELNILDICYGLGYNTLATLYYIEKNNLDIKVNIYSPEFDKQLLKSLKNFKYPKEFDNFKDIINSLSDYFHYNSSKINIELYNGDARVYLDRLKQKNFKMDIVYQDPFSSDVNYLLWTKEYFEQIKDILKKDGIITTYSIATPVRLSIYENRLKIYEMVPKNFKKSTIALATEDIDKRYKYIDMELKKQRNKAASALSDKDIENV